MLYILGIPLANNKPIRIALNSIYGIGPKSSEKICKKLNFNSKFYVNQLTDHQINILIKEIKNYLFGIDLKKKIQNNIQKLIQINCYKGFRHTYGLPVRGQRTHSNGKTQKYLKFKIKKLSSNKK